MSHVHFIFLMNKVNNEMFIHFTDVQLLIFDDNCTIMVYLIIILFISIYTD